MSERAEMGIFKPCGPGTFWRCRVCGFVDPGQAKAHYAGCPVITLEREAKRLREARGLSERGCCECCDRILGGGDE